MTPPKKETARERLYLVDAHAYLHRAYHALPPFTTKGGEPVGALFGFARMLMSLIRREKPEFLAVCFDSPGPTFRHEAYKEYKATRKEVDNDLKKQLALAGEMVRAMGLSTVEARGYEADDLMATLTRAGLSSRLDVVVVSGDKDALQLVGDHVRVLNESKGVLYDADGVSEKFKVGPKQIVDFLALLGDTSDNLPGVPGIGKVGAAKLLAKFDSIDRLVEAARRGNPDVPPKAAKALLENEEPLRLSRRLIALNANVPVSVKPRGCGFKLKPSPELVALFRRFEFRSLLRELEPGAAEPAPAPAGKALKVKMKAVPPEAVLKAAKRAKRVSVAAERPSQPDLLTGPEPGVALALEDGRCAAFEGGEFSRHKSALKALLADGGVSKVGHDLKAAAGVLRGAGLKLSAPGGDTLLAAYCLDPGRGKYSFDAVMREHGLEIPAKGALAFQAAAVWPLRAGLEGQLKAKGLDSLYRKLELPLVEALSEMEAAGMAVDAKGLRELGGKFEGEILRLKGEIDKLAGVEINLRSTKQLGELLYDKLGLPVAHKTKKGGRSTDEEALRALAQKHPIPAKIIDYRELTKLKSTYIDALLQKIVPETGRVHTHFNQAGTATGRLSSLDPNLQNIPVRTAHGREIRRMFTAGKGLVLLSADYSQIDLRVLAHLSEDPVLCGSFKKGEDVHRKTAAEVFGVAPDKVDKEMRRRAKAVNFGIVYGQSAHGLSAELGIPRKEAQDYIDRYFLRYKGVSEWIQGTLESGRRDGHVKTLLGRVRYVPDLNARNFRVRSAAERMAVNTPIQGTAADIIKKAMIAIHAEMAGKSKWKARTLLQVHDELLFELPKREVKAFAERVRGEMEGAVKLKVPVVVDVKTGANWQEMETL